MASPRDEEREFSPGTLINGRYRVEKRLGTGGMGSVYLAKDEVLSNERIAIKILHGELIGDERQMQRFLREVQLMRRINQRNVVRTFDVGNEGDLAYFTMEFVPGKPLEDWAGDQSYPIEKIPQLIVEICQGLEAIHKAGVIHRDLKPANILVLHDGGIKITDFGVARPEYSELTAHNEIVGSALYIAPEVWLGTKMTPSVDLYSLGVMLYELVTGALPFQGDSPAAMMRMHLEYEPEPPKELNSEISPWLNKLILRLLAKSANDRFRDAREVIEYVKLHAGSRVSNAEEFLELPKAEKESELAIHLEKMTGLYTTPETPIAGTKVPVVEPKRELEEPKEKSSPPIPEMMNQTAAGWRRPLSEKQVEPERPPSALRKLAWPIGKRAVLLVIAFTLFGAIPLGAQHLIQNIPAVSLLRDISAINALILDEKALSALPIILFGGLHLFLFALVLAAPIACAGACGGSLRFVFRFAIRGVALSLVFGLFLFSTNLILARRFGELGIGTIVSVLSLIETQLIQLLWFNPFISTLDGVGVQGVALVYPGIAVSTLLSLTGGIYLFIYLLLLLGMLRRTVSARVRGIASVAFGLCLLFSPGLGASRTLCGWLRYETECTRFLPTGIVIAPQENLGPVRGSIERLRIEEAERLLAQKKSLHRPEYAVATWGGIFLFVFLFSLFPRREEEERG